MAWALVFDGVNDYAQINTPIMLTGDFDLEIKFKIYSGAGATSVVLSTQSDGAQWIGRWSTTRHLAFWNGQINFVEGFQVDTDYTYRLVRTGSSVEWFINGVSELTFTNGTTLTIPAFGKLGGASNNLFGQIEYMTIAGVSNYDATNSSHAPGTPILTDFVSGNNATGVNMPTDGSAWLDLGGGGLELTVTELKNSRVNQSLLLASGNVSITATETREARTDASAINIFSVESIAVSTQESRQPRYDSSGLVVVEPSSISLFVGETRDSRLNSSDLYIPSNISISNSEVRSARYDISRLSAPITITVNPRNTVRVKRKNNNVRIKRKTNTIRVK